MPKNVGDLVKIIFAKGFEKLPKVQKIVQSGHTVHNQCHKQYLEKHILRYIEINHSHWLF